MLDLWNHAKQRNIIDTKHKNPFNLLSAGTMLDTKRERRTILKNTGQNDTIVGSYAFNRQVVYPFPYSKTPATDIDIKSGNPRATALQIERALDRQANMNGYYVSKLKHDSGTTYRVHSRLTKDVVADVGKLDKSIPTRQIDGNNYETLRHRKQEINKLLHNPDAEYRRDKDTRMAGYIDRYQTQIDSDLDGVPDAYDCEPQNPYAQGPLHNALDTFSRGMNKVDDYLESRSDNYDKAKQEQYEYEQQQQVQRPQPQTQQQPQYDDRPPIRQNPFESRPEPDIHYPQPQTNDMYHRRTQFASEARRLPSAGPPGTTVQRYSPVTASQSFVRPAQRRSLFRPHFVNPRFLR